MDASSKLLLMIVLLLFSGICYRNGYLEGRASVYKEWTAMPSDGTCLVPGGCDDNDRHQQTSRRRK